MTEDPHVATATDYLIAALGTTLGLLLVLTFIACGWLVLWHTVLHRIGLFREILGLNRAHQQEARKQAERDIQALKKQLGR